MGVSVPELARDTRSTTHSSTVKHAGGRGYLKLMMVVTIYSADFAVYSARSVVHALCQGALLASIVAGTAAVLDNVAYGNCVLGRGLWTVRRLCVCCNFVSFLLKLNVSELHRKLLSDGVTRNWSRHRREHWLAISSPLSLLLSLSHTHMFRFYQGPTIWTRDDLLKCTSFAITPWNSLVYNSSVANLSTHGS